MDISSILPQFDLKQFNKVEFKKNTKGDALGDRQKLVYETLSEYTNGATAKELSVLLHNRGKVMSNERNSVHPRLNELISQGLVKTAGKKTCEYTDRKVTIYKAL